MARGRKKASEVKDLPTTVTDKEEGTIPYFLIDDEWGVSCDDRNEILVHKRNANRIIKNDKGEELYIEQYLMWDSVSYPSSFSKALETYAQRKGRQMESKLNKSKDYNEIAKIQNEIKLIIAQALDFKGINNVFMSTTSVLDDRAELKLQLEALKEAKREVEEETEKLLKLIKEKRQIIVSNTEPKKHRMPKEEE